MHCRACYTNTLFALNLLSENSLKNAFCRQSCIPMCTNRKNQPCTCAWLLFVALHIFFINLFVSQELCTGCGAFPKMLDPMLRRGFVQVLFTIYEWNQERRSDISGRNTQSIPICNWPSREWFFLHGHLEGYRLWRPLWSISGCNNVVVYTIAVYASCLLCGWWA